MPDHLVIDLFQRLGMALALGFLVGVERGWRHRSAPDESRAAGLRTHAIIGLSGGVAAALLPQIGEIGFAALASATAVAIIVFKVRESERDHDMSVTGTVAALLVFALGAYAVLGSMAVAAAAGVALVALLAFKHALHGWLAKLTWKELRSALLILAATLIALPLLPDRTIDPWNAINLRELWLLTILVATASFAGYLAVRLLGADIGILAGAAAGALVSSTVVTAELGRRARAGEASTAAAAAGAALAAAVSVSRVVVLVAVTAAAAAPEIGPALCAAALGFALSSFALIRLNRDRTDAMRVDPLQSPLYIGSVAKFALFLGAVIVVGRIVADRFGQAGLLPFAATAGLADVDAVALAAGSLIRGGLDVALGGHAILIAVTVNTYSKAVIAWFTGGARYAALYLGAATAALAIGAAAWITVTPWLAPLFAGAPSS